MAANPAPPAAPKKAGMSTFMMFLTFGAVLLVMLDPNLRNFLGNALGVVLNPLIGFQGKHPVWTVFFASVVMILVTTVIRHFLTDWVKTARTQEVMRQFNKELSSARKENNTYKLKRLMDQQPEIMKIQAEMSSEQMKPMAFTMLVVIPIFAWLLTLTGVPVAYHVEPQPETDAAVLVLDSTLNKAMMVGKDGTTFSTIEGFLFYSIPLEGPAPPVVAYDLAREGPREVAGGSQTAINLTQYRLRDPFNATDLTLAPGSYVVTTRDSGSANGFPLQNAAVYVRGNSTKLFFTATHANTPLELTEPAAVYVLLPSRSPGGTFEGSLALDIRRANADVPVTYKLDARNILEVGSFPSANLIPHPAKVPWNTYWDLNGVYILPHWIALYSLFSIPFGTLTQKALKVWEYRHVTRKEVATQ